MCPGRNKPPPVASRAAPARLPARPYGSPQTVAPTPFPGAVGRPASAALCEWNLRSAPRSAHKAAQLEPSCTLLSSLRDFPSRPGGPGPAEVWYDSYTTEKRSAVKPGFSVQTTNFLTLADLTWYRCQTTLCGEGLYACLDFEARARKTQQVECPKIGPNLGPGDGHVAHQSAYVFPILHGANSG